MRVSSLYSQLMAAGPEAQNDLIQQNPAYLEEFLREEVGLSAGPAPIHATVKKLPALLPKAVNCLEVLGRLYVHRHMFSHAAYLQLLLGERLNMSEEDPTFVSLEKRQQHLLDALRLAKSRSQYQGIQSPDTDNFSDSLLDVLQCKMMRYIYGWGSRSHVGTSTLSLLYQIGCDILLYSMFSKLGNVWRPRI